MKKVIICDDEEKAISILGEMIEKRFPKQFSISGYVSARQLIYEIEDDYLQSADLIFLDLEMEEFDGIEVAKFLQKKLPMAKIVFITGYLDRTEEIFDDVYPFGLMLKPFNEERLAKYIQRESKEEEKTETLIKLKQHGNQIYISVEEVLYVESRGRKLWVHKKDGMECAYEKISSFCEMYQKYFVRCHQSYAVNWNHVKKVSMTGITLKNGETIPVSRQKYREVREKIFQ